MNRSEKIRVAPFGTNCYFVTDRFNNAVIIDPGGSFNRIDRYLQKNKLTLKAAICTHGHFDHLGALAEIQEKYDITAYIHISDEALVKKAHVACDYFEIPRFRIPHFDILLKEEKSVTTCGTHIDIIHTPGHTAGSISLYIREYGMLFTGDTLFRETIGTIDSEKGSGSMEDLTNSIKQKLYTLPDNTTVYPGHGKSTDIAFEKRNNPFISETDLCNTTR